MFRVAEEDAKTLAGGFSHYEAPDLQNLGVGEAIARIERPDFDFNLRVNRPARVPEDQAAQRRHASLAASRSRYASPVAASEQSHEPAAVEGVAVTEPPAIGETGEGPQPHVATRERSLAEREPYLPGRGGPQHKCLQSLVKRLAEDRGFMVTIEHPVIEGHGHVDVVLERNGFKVACEITVTTRVAHEVGNITKCLAVGFDHAILVCSERKKREAAKILLTSSDPKRVRVILPEDVVDTLDELLVAYREARSTQNEGREATQAYAGRSSADRQPFDKKQLRIASDAAAYVGLARQTLAKLRVVGGLPPYFKVGRRVVYDRTDLDAWLAARRRRSTSSGDTHSMRRVGPEAHTNDG